MKTKLHFYCRAERRKLGTVSGVPGRRVNKAYLLRQFEPEQRHEDWNVCAKAKQGRLLLCPRCDNPVNVGLDDQELQSVFADDARVVVGAFIIPEKKATKRYNKSEGTPDELRKTDVYSEDDEQHEA